MVEPVELDLQRFRLVLPVLRAYTRAGCTPAQMAKELERVVKCPAGEWTPEVVARVLAAMRRESGASGLE